MKIGDIAREFPNTIHLLDRARQRYRVIEKALSRIESEFGMDHLEFSEHLLKIYFDNDPDRIEKALGAFIKYSNEYLLLQIKLQKTGRYLFNSFEEVNARVYQADLMRQYYLDGLCLSQLMWPNHFKMLHWLNASFHPKENAHVLDIPCGTGVQSFSILRRGYCGNLHICDLSPHSVEYASSALARLHPRANVTAQVCSVFDLKSKDAYDFIVCGELLEHLEQPQALLEHLCQMLAPSGRIYLTTAIFAAAIDHIYLFRTVAEVRAMLTKFFAIDSEVILPVSLQPFEETMRDEAINYACILKKRTPELVSRYS